MCNEEERNTISFGSISDESMSGLFIHSTNDFILILSLNENIDQVCMANSVSWYGHKMSREDGHVLRMELQAEVEGQRKQGRMKRT